MGTRWSIDCSGSGEMRCPVSSPSLTLSDGRSVVLAELLGRGSLGSVYRAVVESAFGVRRPVAIKIFDVVREDEPGEIVRRLAHTAQRVACVQHSAVVQTFEVDRMDGRRTPQAFVMTELVEGESLGDLLATWRHEGRRVPLDFALAVGARVAEGLAAALFSEAPEGGVTALVHGDVTPNQVLVSKHGDVKVGDFGQGALRDLASRVRSRGRLAYTAPEVASGYAADPRADVFSVGVVLHEMLVGPRFPAGISAADAMAIVRDGTMPSSWLDPVLPSRLRAVLDRALAPNPADRQIHALHLATELRREVMRLGLVDTQTCVRHAVVGWCEVPPRTDARTVRVSEIVPCVDDEPAPDTSREGQRASNE